MIAMIERLQDFRSSTFMRLIALAMLSAIARQLCSQTRSWGHVADNVYPAVYSAKDVARAASNWIARTRARFDYIGRGVSLPKSRPFFSVRRVDWMLDEDIDLKRGCAQLLLTSPPYAGAIDYVLSQRLSLYLLGYDAATVSSLCARETGARRKRFNPHHVANWAADLEKETERQVATLSEMAFAAFVMPHKDHGRDAGVTALRQFMAQQGWTLAFSRDRSIRQVRARQSWTSIKRETMLIFERSFHD